ncbi:MAG: MATE family efflux transporter [Fimbriimonadaceae bacterium]|nr:MATE family efflux transporter [Fimbriimonadaceae bacterium]QYK57032.1 MAG: MATE family efflux transporter [Fimbriimonadaceae bacterium]
MSKVPKEENLSRVVWDLAWPSVTLNALQTVNSLLGSVFLEGLPQANLTAIGASTSILFLFVSLSFALGVAATAIVSRRFGEGEVEQYREANQKVLSVGIFAGLILAVVCFASAPAAASMLIPDTDTEARALMVRYLGVFSFSLPPIFVIQILAGSLRGTGDTRSPMVVSGGQILLHIALNILLIFPARQVNGFTIPGAGLGLVGEALGLTISAFLAALVYLVWSRRAPLKTRLSFAWPGMDWAKRILNIASPAALMSLLRVTSLMAFTYVLKLVPQSSAAIAAMRPAIGIESIAFMPAFGVSLAASSLVGQSLGMRRPDRAERVAWAAAHQAGGISILMSLVLVFGAHQLAGLILPNQPEVAKLVASFLIYVGATETLFGYGAVMVGAMQGAGETRGPFWLTLLSMWGLRVPMAFVFALPFGLAMGAEGCWLAMSVSQAIHGLAAIWLFRIGRWKETTV